MCLIDSAQSEWIAKFLDCREDVGGEVKVLGMSERHKKLMTLTCETNRGFHPELCMWLDLVKKALVTWLRLGKYSGFDHI